MKHLHRPSAIQYRELAASLVKSYNRRSKVTEPERYDAIKKILRRNLIKAIVDQAVNIRETPYLELADMINDEIIRSGYSKVKPQLIASDIEKLVNSSGLLIPVHSDLQDAKSSFRHSTLVLMFSSIFRTTVDEKYTIVKIIQAYKDSDACIFILLDETTGKYTIARFWQSVMQISKWYAKIDYLDISVQETFTAIINDYTDQMK